MTSLSGARRKTLRLQSNEFLKNNPEVMKMSKRTLMAVVLAVACALTMANASYAQQNGPFNKVRLMKLLLLDTSPQEIIQAVNQKGVDFQPTAQDENELRQSGASDDLMAA